MLVQMGVLVSCVCALRVPPLCCWGRLARSARVCARAVWPLRSALVRCVLVLCVLVLCVRCARAVCFGGVVLKFVAIVLWSLIVVANIA